MDDKDMELLEMIRDNDNPGQALMTAATIILGFLKQHESSVKRDPSYLQELC